MMALSSLCTNMQCVSCVKGKSQIHVESGRSLDEIRLFSSSKVSKHNSPTPLKRHFHQRANANIYLLIKSSWFSLSQNTFVLFCITCGHLFVCLSSLHSWYKLHHAIKTKYKKMMLQCILCTKRDYKIPRRYML